MVGRSNLQNWGHFGKGWGPVSCNWQLLKYTLPIFDHCLEKLLAIRKRSICWTFFLFFLSLLILISIKSIKGSSKSRLIIRFIFFLNFMFITYLNGLIICIVFHTNQSLALLRSSQNMWIFYIKNESNCPEYYCHFMISKHN